MKTGIKERAALNTLSNQIRKELVIDRRCEFCKHACLIIKKRTNIYRRSLKTLVLEIIIPLILILTGFSSQKIIILYQSESRELSTDLYGREGEIERILVNANVVNPASDS